MLARDARNGGQRLDRLRHLLLETFGHHHFRFNVHLPAGQFGGEPSVLAAFADRERKLIVADGDFDAFMGFVYLKSFEFRG